MTRKIVRWDTGAVIWEGEVEFVREAIHAALKARADLTWADLTRADLTGANLTGAHLTWANLTGADLTGAHLTWANLTEANLMRANLTEANLTGAHLTGANLTGADLTWANLTGANLTGAHLTWANLTGANLTGADLTGAHLSGATGVQPERCTPLLMLLDQPDPMRAYKLVNQQSQGPFSGGVTYVMGEVVSVNNANTDASVHCGAGINVATLDWCLANYSAGYRVLILEFTAEDIACIPTATDGKFRLHRATVVGEKDISALVNPTEAVPA